MFRTWNLPSLQYNKEEILLPLRELCTVLSLISLLPTVVVLIKNVSYVYRPLSLATRVQAKDGNPICTCFIEDSLKKTNA